MNYNNKNYGMKIYSISDFKKVQEIIKEKKETSVKSNIAFIFKTGFITLAIIQILRGFLGA